MTEDQKDLIREAAQALRDACMFRYDEYTKYSCTDRRDWTYEEECRYGSECDYELSLKLDKLAEDEIPEVNDINDIMLCGAGFEKGCAIEIVGGRKLKMVVAYNDGIPELKLLPMAELK